METIYAISYGQTASHAIVFTGVVFQLLPPKKRLRGSPGLDFQPFWEPEEDDTGLPKRLEIEPMGVHAKKR